MRPYPITVLKGGINRLRVKGGAAADSLYDLQNGYITNAGSVVPREGTFRTVTLDSSTVGLAAANGQFNIFSSTFGVAPPGYVLNVLSNPNNTTASPVKIYFAKPFMGFPYVVASFSDGSVFHYWLQNSGTWTSSTTYTSASIVLPPVANGIAYQGLRDFPPQPLWTAETTITSGSYVEPNTPTGFLYQAVATTGTPVHTGATEPVWPTVAGGIVQEFGDFDVSTSDAGTTQKSNSAISTASALSRTITDRYGDSQTVSNSGVFSNSTVSTLTLASTKITTWKGGTNYAPGAVVIPTSSQGAFVNAIPNGDFEGGSGAGGWTFTDPGGATQWAYSTVLPYQGAEGLTFPGGSSVGAGGGFATMTSFSLVTPGQSVTASAYLDPNNNGANLTLWIQLNWYNSADSIISSSGWAQNEQEGGGYRLTSITATAPPSAAHVRVSIGAGSGTNSRNAGFVDLVTWNLATPAPITNFLFEAVQPTAGSSAATEPTWPTVLGNQVIDGGVTWKAIGTSIITWQAIPIMYSGLTAPTFPTTIGNAVHDNSTYSNINGYVTTFTSMSWQAVDRHIADPKDPNSVAVAIGASHVFAGSNDIVPYSAAVNPTDWTSTNNAGYLPTGLNNYGDNPVTALALYRGNLIVFNAGGYQMWQIDPDPQNMAFLDAQPVGSIWPRAAQSVANDLLFLTEIGVRNLGTIGATANMAIGNTGQQVDPLVLAQIQAATYDPFSIYYPGRGQYWLIYGPQVFVLTINGLSGTKTWARYIFPQAITDATLNEGFLYLRTANNFVWQVSTTAQTDDIYLIDPTVSVLLPFSGSIANASTIINPPPPVFTNGGAAVVASTPAPYPGGGVLNCTSPANTDIIHTQISTGGALDFSAAPNWTIQGWIQCHSLGISTLVFITLGFNGSGTKTGVALSSSGQAAGDLTMSIYGATTNPGYAPQITPVTSDAWHHFAMCKRPNISGPGDQYQLFVDGIGTGWTSSLTPFIGPYTAWTGGFCINGYTADGIVFTGGDNVNFGAYYADISISTQTLHDGNFAPPTGPFTLNPTQPVSIPFNGVLQWPYLDMGTLGRNKMLVGIDLVGEGNCSIQIGFNQSDKTTFNDNPNFATSTGVTAPYFVTVDDTVPGEPLPIPINAPSYSVILTFTGSTATANTWSWQAANLYVTDASGAGAMG
jgi:hypothetical protein